MWYTHTHTHIYIYIYLPHKHTDAHQLDILTYDGIPDSAIPHCLESNLSLHECVINVVTRQVCLHQSHYYYYQSVYMSDCNIMK